MIPNTLTDTVVGQTVTIEANLIIPAGLNTGGATITWELQDVGGVVYASGNAQSINQTTLNALKQSVVADASLTIPMDLPVTQYGTKYQILWTMVDQNQVPLSTYTETFSVRTVTQEPFGVPDVVEVTTDTMYLSAVLPSNQVASVNLYLANSLLSTAPISVPFGGQTYEGGLYKKTLTDINATYGVTPSLEPYQALWQYTDVLTNEVINEDGYIYHVTPTILGAAKELQQLVNRAQNTARLRETSIDFNVCIAFLKMGADYFNSLGMPTMFDMTNAQGAIRRYWVVCSEILILQSQYLLEAERSMTMQGQSVTLDIDITQYYETMAQNLQSTVDTYVPDFKKNLNRRGILGGDGNYNTTLSRNVGAIGISLSPISNYYANFSRRYGRFRG